jgi:hypothetical protein
VLRGVKRPGIPGKMFLMQTGGIGHICAVILQSAIMRPIRLALPAVCLLAGLTRTAVAQQLPETVIKEARRFQFIPQPGTAWMIEGSGDGMAWHDVAGPFFATGKPVDHLMTRGMEKSYRLRYMDPATTGPAPLSPAGQTLTMEHQGQARELIFLDATTGIYRLDDFHARTFTFIWTKPAADRAEAILSGTDGSFTLLRLEFHAAGLGRWGMEDIPSPAAAAQVKQTIDSGGFALTAGRVLRGEENILLPQDFNGRRLLLNESGQLSILEFNGADAVTRLVTGQPAQTGSYTYDPESNTSGLLTLTLPGMPAGGFTITLNTPATGRMVQNGGQPPRSGTFSLPGEAPGAPVHCPPLSLAGRSYIFADSAPCTLVFYANGEGVQKKDRNGVTEVTHFRYLYSRTGGAKATVAISFPGAAGDLVDDYELDFKDDCTGNYKRSSYAAGLDAGRRNSTFSPAPPEDGNP